MGHFFNDYNILVNSSIHHKTRLKGAGIFGMIGFNLDEIILVISLYIELHKPIGLKSFIDSGTSTLGIKQR